MSSKSLPKFRAGATAQAQPTVSEETRNESTTDVETEEVDGGKKTRVAYQPKSVLEFEQYINGLSERARNFKAQIYTTTAPKQTGVAPTRRDFDELSTGIKAVIRDYKALHRLLESKPKRKTSQTDGKTRAGGFKNPCMVDDALASFMNDHINKLPDLVVIDDTCISTRALLTSSMTQYAYDNNLRDPNDATKIRPDKALMELFKDDFVESKVDPNGFPHTHMQKLLTRHVLKADVFEAKRKEKNITDEMLKQYKDHLDSIQEHFKLRKAEREAAKPKVKPAKSKKAAVESQQPSTSS